MAEDTATDKAVEVMARAHVAVARNGGGQIEATRAALAAYHTHLAEQGMVIVPEVPTEAMLDAGFAVLKGAVSRSNIYTAMIHAAKTSGPA